MAEETSNNGHREDRKRAGDPYGYRHRSSGKRKQIIYLWMLIFAETLVLIFLVVRLGMVEKENNDLTFSERASTEELERLKPEFEKMKADMDRAVRGRLPGLIAIEVDHVIPVNMEYVKNIMFSVSGTKEERKLEYKLLLENNSSYSVTPKLELLFFDKTGLQQGLAKIGFEKDPNVREVLERAETRSFSGGVDFSGGTPPEYFMARLSK